MTPSRNASSRIDSSGCARSRSRVERAAERFAHALAGSSCRATNASFISRPGLVGHAERAVAQSGGDVLRRRAEARDLVVVNRGRAVHRDVRDDAAAHEIDEQRREAGLHDVPAEHERRRRACARRGVTIASTTARKSRATSTSGSASRNAANERSSRRRMRELDGAHLVRAARDGNRCERRRDPLRAVSAAVRLGRRGSAATFVVGDGRYDLR